MVRHHARLSNRDTMARKRRAKLCLDHPDIDAAARAGDIPVDNINELARAYANGALFSLAGLSAPSLAQFGPSAASLAYLQSYGFFVFLARNHGEKKLLELLDDYLRNRHLERAFRRTFRADLARLEERYGQELSAATR
jgi:hypothetical protein